MAGQSPRRRAASLVGPLRPCRWQREPGRRWSLGRSLAGTTVLSHNAISLIAASGRRPAAGALTVASASLRAPARRRSPRDPRNRRCARPKAAWRDALPRTDFASGGRGGLPSGRA